MSNLNERLDRLKVKIQDKDFLEGNGLSNEVNINMFCYDAAEEMTVRHFTNQLTLDSTLACHIVECNLYEMFLSICEDKRIMKGIPNMEERKGKDYLFKQLRPVANGDSIIRKIKEKDFNGRNDVLLITGVGDVFPFLRVHKLLEALQPHFFNTPIVVMYPGRFDGDHVYLFNKLPPNSYYRAFNVD